jgi:nucleoside-diphosphate-sugar epimerase
MDTRMLNNIKGRKVLLIGGAGFIGHNLALELHKRGAEVSILDSLYVNNYLNLLSASHTDYGNKNLYTQVVQQRINLLQEAEIPMYIQDARDYYGMGKVINHTVKPDVVVVLAAVAHAGRSNKDPFSTFDHSFRTLENALDCCRGTVEHFIYFSSSMVYGNFQGDSVTEETHCEPIGIYGALKLGGEHLVKAYQQVFDLNYTIVRPSALYGERCISRRVGQIFIENALEGKGIVVKGDGSDKLDFTYIGDLVGGVINCIENRNSYNQTLNITYGRGRSLDEMADILKQHFPNVEIKHMERDGLMPERGTLSVEKAKSLVGYNPQNPLEVGYVKYINWYKESFGAQFDKGSVNLPQIYE